MLGINVILILVFNLIWVGCYLNIIKVLKNLNVKSCFRCNWLYVVFNCDN